MQEAIPFHRPYYGRAAAARAARALDQESLHGNGRSLQAVEARLCDLLCVSHVMLTPSCTSALEIAAQAAGLGPGDEFVIPSYTFLSSAAALSATGARPVFVDVHPENLCIDLNATAAAITDRTRAIVAVHYAGKSCDLNKLTKLAEAHGLIIIEDAAQAFLCRQDGRGLGTVGHFGCFSFHDSKVFTTGEGGALVVNDRAFLDRATRIREKGSNRREFLAGRVDKYGWVAQGTSGYMGGFPATLLDAQLDERSSIIARRQAIFARYDAELRPAMEARGWRVIRHQPAEELTYHIYWTVADTVASRLDLADFLKKRGISATSHYPCLHRAPYVLEQGWQPQHPLSVAEHVEGALIRLPLFTQMSEDDVERVIDAILTYFAQSR